MLADPYQTVLTRNRWSIGSCQNRPSAW